LTLSVDQNKFINLLIEKTNGKLSQFQNQIIILETQLQIALDSNKSLQLENDKYKLEIEKLKKKKEKSSANQTDDFSTPN
jgi:regulator of replication initiation timing